MKGVRDLVAVVLAACVSNVACGSEAETPEGLTGQWCGAHVGAPAECNGAYLDITQSGSSVSGQACEWYEHDCYPLDNGTLSGAALTFDYSWTEAGTTYTVNASLALSADGNTLSGSYHSSKCNCDTPMTFFRI